MNGQKHIYDEFLSFRDGLVDYATTLLKSRSEAEDMVQDLYLKLWSRKDSLSEIKNPEAYCKTVLKNRALDKLEALESRTREEMPQDFLSEAAEGAEKLEKEEELKLTLAEMDKLPQGQSDALKMKALDELSYSEISQRSGMREQAVRTQVSLARKALRSRVAWIFAAACLIVASIFLFKPKELQDTYDDPAQAYAELERTLAYISNKVDYYYKIK